jgi:hypothetical protein
MVTSRRRVRAALDRDSLVSSKSMPACARPSTSARPAITSGLSPLQRPHQVGRGMACLSPPAVPNLPDACSLRAGPESMARIVHGPPLRHVARRSVQICLVLRPHVAARVTAVIHHPGILAGRFQQPPWPLASRTESMWHRRTSLAALCDRGVSGTLSQCRRFDDRLVTS